VRRPVWMLAFPMLVACLSSPARAYEEQLTLGAAAGYAALLDSDPLPRDGIHFALSAGSGFGDAWSIEGFTSYSLYFDERPLHIGMAGLETVYALDIVRFVPLIGAGLDGILTVRSRDTRGDFALHALLGIDFLVNPRWIVGADVRGFWVATNGKSPLGPFIVTAALRVGARLDLR
jgi:hypothetical protein